MVPNAFNGSLTEQPLHAALLGLLAGLLIAYLVYRLVAIPRMQRKAQQVAARDIERAGRMERERLRTISHLIATLTATLKYQRVLDTALDLGGSALGIPDATQSRLISAALLFSKGEDKAAKLRVGTARRFTPADMRTMLPGKIGLVARVIESGEAEMTKRLTQDAELGRFIALRACSSAYCLPLRTGLDTYGVLLYAHPDPDFFSPTRRETLDIIASQAVISLQNARLYSDLEQEKERMMEIQEEARKKLARDLHDGPTQSVAAIAMRLNFTRRLMERDVTAATGELSKIEELARRTTKEIRHMLFTLRPLVLESQGLLAALEVVADKMRETYNQNISITADSEIVSKLEASRQTVVFYIAEEAINNARKHAQAARIWVRLKQVEEEIALLEIEDDGVGFNLGEVDASYDHRGSLGMINMRERAELVNGVLSIDSQEGRGTRIQVLIPLSEDAADRVRRGL